MVFTKANEVDDRLDLIDAMRLDLHLGLFSAIFKTRISTREVYAACQDPLVTH